MEYAIKPTPGDNGTTGHVNVLITGAIPDLTESSKRPTFHHCEDSTTLNVPAPDVRISHHVRPEDIKSDDIVDLYVQNIRVTRVIRTAGEVTSIVVDSGPDVDGPWQVDMRAAHVSVTLVEPEILPMDVWRLLDGTMVAITDPNPGGELCAATMPEGTPVVPVSAHSFIRASRLFRMRGAA